MTKTSWMTMGMDAWMLGVEASSVIGLRTLKMAAGGPAAAAEADLMVREKLDSSLLLQMKAMTGQLGMTPAAALSNTLAHYRRKVRANRKRLGGV